MLNMGHSPKRLGTTGLDDEKVQSVLGMLHWIAWGVNVNIKLVLGSETRTGKNH